MIEHKDGLYGPPGDPDSTPICLSYHFYFPSIKFSLWSVSFPPSLTPRRIKCIRGTIHLLPLSDTGSQLSADRKGPIKHWRKGNTVGQLIFYSTLERRSSNFGIWSESTYRRDLHYSVKPQVFNFSQLMIGPHFPTLQYLINKMIVNNKKYNILKKKIRLVFNKKK